MSMINCPECGKEISDKAKKCVHCGKVLIEDKPATKVCSDCGKENPIDATECVHCGCPFEEGTTVETPVQIAPVEKPKRDLKKIIIPIVVAVHLGAQNGFGGNTESFALCAYSKEKKEYKLDAYTKSDDIEQIKEDYDSDDDNYFMYMLGAALLKGYEENGIEVGSIDMDRFKTILKNDAYSTIRIIE